MESVSDNHNCPWRVKAEELSQRIEQLERMLFGKRSEKMPSLKKELNQSVDQQASRANREERRAQRNNLPETKHEHKVTDKDKCCPKCGSADLKKVGEGKVSSIIEYVPARLERQIHIQETLACPCGDYMVTAKAPVRPVEGGHYGPALMANIVTSKCVDSIPLYRMEKQLARAGLKLSRSSLCNLFHQTAEAINPIYCQHQLKIDP